jgi:hypothetical protein
MPIVGLEDIKQNHMINKLEVGRIEKWAGTTYLGQVLFFWNKALKRQIRPKIH